MGVRASVLVAIWVAVVAVAPAYAAAPAVGLPSGVEMSAPAVAPAPVEAPPKVIVVKSIRNPGVPVDCAAAEAKYARSMAEEARRAGEHRKAAACYRVAGDPVEADKAQAKAFVENGEVASRKASATIDDAREQARRVREAFRAKPAARRS